LQSSEEIKPWKHFQNQTPIYFDKKKTKQKAGCWWLTLIILDTQEAEIRIEVQSQPRQIICKTLSQKYQSQKGLVEWLKLKP
jgi:hypothetical protein